MPNAGPVNWQPIGQMPLVASMIHGSLDDTSKHLQTLTEARTQPHVLDDATIDRVEQVHTGQMDFIDIYTQQISCWRTEKPSADRTRELDRMGAQNAHSRAVTADVLALASELRDGTIERVLAMTDAELGLHALLTNRQSGRR